MNAQLQIIKMQTSLLSDGDKRAYYLELKKQIESLNKPVKKKKLTTKELIEFGRITVEI